MAKMFKAFRCDACGKLVDAECSYYTEIFSCVDGHVDGRKEHITLCKECGSKVEKFVNALKEEKANDLNR